MSDTRVCSERQARRGRFSSGTSFGFEPSEQAPHDQRQYRRWDRPLEHQPGVGRRVPVKIDYRLAVAATNLLYIEIALAAGETIHMENYHK